MPSFYFSFSWIAILLDLVQIAIISSPVAPPPASISLLLQPLIVFVIHFLRCEPFHFLTEYELSQISRLYLSSWPLSSTPDVTEPLSSLVPFLISLAPSRQL